MPLDQVHRGMRCTGLTVVQGTDISSFDVEVVDVVTGQPPEGPRILVRVSGAAVEGTGVAEGFSGSPVYCNDSSGTRRVIGAISETVGQYGESVALATPIEQMLGSPVDPPPDASHDPALLRRARPLRGALTVAGVSGRLGRALEAQARRDHRAFRAVPPGPLGTYAPQQLRPGASLAAGYSAGDLALGAVGTVTYTDGDAVWGFGHPFEGAGQRALLMQDAYVYTVIGNPLDVQDATSSKLAAPGHVLGTITNDTPNGVVGRVGVLPELADLRASARDLQTGAVRYLDAQVADEAAVGFPTGVSPLVQVAELALLQQATTILDGTPARESGDMCLKVVLRVDEQPLRFCNRYVVQGTSGGGDPLGPVAPLMANDLDEGLGLISSAQFADLAVRSVDIGVQLRRGLALAELEGGRALNPRLRGGDRLKVALRVRIVRGPVRKVAFSVRVPHALKPGRHELHLSGGGLDDELAGATDVTLQVGSGGTPEVSADSGAGSTSGPTSLEDLRDQFKGIARYDGLAGRFTGGGGRFAAYRDPKLRIDGSASIPFQVK
jgi:hypothetical protein